MCMASACQCLAENKIWAGCCLPAVCFYPLCYLQLAQLKQALVLLWLLYEGM